MQKLTKEQAIVITGFTGFTACNFSDFQKEVEKRLGHATMTHEFAVSMFAEEVRELFREDFLAMCPQEEF